MVSSGAVERKPPIKVGRLGSAQSRAHKLNGIHRRMGKVVSHTPLISTWQSQILMEKKRVDSNFLKIEEMLSIIKRKVQKTNFDRMKLMRETIKLHFIFLIFFTQKTNAFLSLLFTYHSCISLSSLDAGFAFCGTEYRTQSPYTELHFQSTFVLIQLQPFIYLLSEQILLGHLIASAGIESAVLLPKNPRGLGLQTNATVLVSKLKFNTLCGEDKRQLSLLVEERWIKFVKQAEKV